LDPDINKGKWTVEEDSTLIGAVKKRGKYWTRVAALVPGRTNRQCCQRWVVSLDPDINTFKWKVWTAEEDAKLTEAVAEFGNDWVRVAALVPGRTNIQCRWRWVDSLDPIISTGKWAADEEDAKLTDAVTINGVENWAAAAALVPARTNTQCRHRWASFLDPNNNNNSTGKWTVEVDAKLAEAVTSLYQSCYARSESNE
jgi:myb proto-oncogene protein